MIRIHEGGSTHSGSLALLSVLLAFVALHLFPLDSSSQATTEEKPTITEKEVSSDSVGAVRLIFAGDCTFGGHFETFVGDDFSYPFNKLSWFAEADVSMVNLENPITNSGEKIRKQFNFKMKPKYLEVLVRGGIDIVSLANNHTYDYGPQGLLDTMHYLDSVGIKYVGAGRNLEEARRAEVFEVKGMRLGYLAYHGGGEFAATSEKPGIAPRLEKIVIPDIRRLKQQGDVDFVIVNFHWGVEKALYPLQWQTDLARRAVDAGADLIVGHHPHVLQGIEKYREAVIAYSLGNFLFGGKNVPTYDTAVLEVLISSRVREFVLIPVRVVNWQPQKLEGAEAEKILSSVRTLSQRFPRTIF